MAKAIIGKACKLFSVIIAAAVLAACVLVFSACESKNPEIRITVSFNGTEYELEYKLYRSYAPQTVAHYIELIDLNYFDNTVIHDYQDDRMIGGGFTYEGMENGDVMDDLVQLDYDGATTNSDGSLKLNNISVWTDADHAQATNRLYGETSLNGFSVENGGLSNKLGALGTYTYARSMAGDSGEGFGMNTMVYTRQSNGQDGASAYYKNSFQGMFYIYTSTSSSTDSEYCVFGELKDEDAESKFQELLDAIDAYTTDKELDRFTEELSDSRIEDSLISGGSYEPADNFLVPQCKIIIEDVTVTKY